MNEIGNLHLARGDGAQMMKAFIESMRMFLRNGCTVADVVVVPTWTRLPTNRLCHSSRITRIGGPFTQL
jgi:hypothetical protein